MDEQLLAQQVPASLIEIIKRSVQNQSATNESAYTHGLLGVNQQGNYLFVNTLVICFFVLCGCCLLFRLYTLAHSYFRQVLTAGAAADRHAIFSANRTSIWPWFKRYVLYAPLWNKRHNKEIQLSSAVSIGTLPSRFHTILLSIYVITNIAYCFVLDYSQENRAATIAELRGRSGALAAINLIPTVLFAMRNNPFIPLLHVSYDTFNLFHRWAARVVIAESSLHVLAWAINAVTTSGGPGIGTMLRQSVSFQWGAVGAVLFLVIGVQAWSPIRHASYEFFINSHRLLVLIALIGVYVHLETANLPQLPYVVLAFLAWVTEWTIRGLKIIFYNYSGQRRTTVIAEALDGGATRVTFNLTQPWKFRPGCHVHVYLPQIGLWSSHPFSVAWSKTVQRCEVEEKLPTTEVNLDKEDDVTTSLSLVIRAREGMTGKLFKRASAAPGKVISLWGMVEGPYGGHESLDSYGTVLLFAAGVGITHQLGYVRHLVRGATDGTLSARKIVLAWSIPEKACLEWVREWTDEILKIPGRKDVLQIHIFVTRAPKGEALMVSGSGMVKVVPGRCDAQKMVDTIFMERVGAMVVTVCGPGVFSDDIRHAVRKRVQLGSVDFIEEAFTY